jgi:hypothetical protein
MAKKKIKKQLTLQELREAQKKEIQLSDYKKLADKKFRNEAEKESFISSSSLNSEIRENTKQKKATKGEIQRAKNEITHYSTRNKKIKENVKQLKEEYVFSDDERKKEIERLLEKPDYKEKDLFTLKNNLKKLEGKDFDYIVDNGFEKYKINTKELKKNWKQGDDVTLPILRKMKTDSEKAINHYKKLIQKEKKTASKEKMKKLKRILTGLEEKLNNVIEKNIEALETGDMSILDEYDENGEKYYSILFKVVGYRIDRIGI